MRAALIILTSLLATASAFAQEPGNSTPAPTSTTEAPARGDRHNQQVERIQHEDGGSRVDELRIGGETKRITVQPKVGGLPAYEVQPANAARQGQSPESDGTNGRRVWNAVKF